VFVKNSFVSKKVRSYFGKIFFFFRPRLETTLREFSKTFLLMQENGLSVWHQYVDAVEEARENSQEEQEKIHELEKAIDVLRRVN